MRSVLVVADGHYYKTANGDIYAENTHTYAFFSRYLSAFDKVLVLARVSCEDCDIKRLKQANGENVEFVELPDYSGVVQQARFSRRIFGVTHNAIRRVDCILLRVPSATSNSIWWLCKKSGKPIALEVVVDPDKYFGKGTADSILTPLVQRLWTRQLQNMCMCANGVSYVTKEYLQSKYPCRAMLEPGDKYFTSYYSSVCLEADDFGIPREFTKIGSEVTLLHVCNYINGYRKGHITVIKILRMLLDQGINAKVRFVGDGAMVDKLRSIARQEGVEKNIYWVGRLHNSKELEAEYKGADFLLLPSMGEGLPRVLLEGMAYGTICLASSVCGIPELLPEDMLYDHDDAEGFTNRIIYLKDNPQVMEEISYRNIEVAREYSEELLNKRREEFYKNLCRLAR